MVNKYTFGIMSAMNFWPPNPGSTVIIRIISTSSTNGKTDSTGVLGLTPIPTLKAVTYSHQCNVIGKVAKQTSKVC